MLRGYPDQAARQIEQTLGLEHEMASSFTNVYAQCVAPLGSQCLRDAQAPATQADAGVTLGTQKGFPVWIAFGTVLRGWGQFAQGVVTAGIAKMHTGLAAMQELGAKSQLPHYLTMLAEAVGTTGDSAQALQHADEALAEAGRGGERFYEPEAWRVKGELILQSKACPEPGRRVQRGRRSGGMFSESARGCPPAGRQIIRATDGDESEPVVAAAGENGRTARSGL